MMMMALNRMGRQLSATKSVPNNNNSDNRRTPSSASRAPHFRLLRCLFLLILLLSSAPNASDGAGGGFRLCGLKLTMMLNAICKQQLCGGFVLKKKRSFSSSGQSSHSSALPLDLARIWLPNEGEDAAIDAEEEQEQSEQMLRHHFVPSTESAGDEPTKSVLLLDGDDQQGLMRWTKRATYPFMIFGTTKKSGIATECCSKRCTLSYMKTYCCSTPMGRMNSRNIIDGDDEHGEDGDEHGEVRTDETEERK